MEAAILTRWSWMKERGREGERERDAGGRECKRQGRRGSERGRERLAGDKERAGKGREGTSAAGRRCRVMELMGKDQRRGWKREMEGVKALEKEQRGCVDMGRLEGGR